MTFLTFYLIKHNNIQQLYPQLLFRIAITIFAEDAPTVKNEFANEKEEGNSSDNTADNCMRNETV